MKYLYRLAFHRVSTCKFFLLNGVFFKLLHYRRNVRVSNRGVMEAVEIIWSATDEYCEVPETTATGSQ